VREVIWVVPDDTWRTRRGRRDIVRTLRQIDQGTPKKKPAIRMETDWIISAALGKPLHVCTAQNLPQFNEDILLDIDVDYLIIPNIGYRDIDVYGGLPWCWPTDLLATLKARGIHTDLATIAYSVQGGYTPLQWKYLGDELAQRLQLSPQDLTWAESMRRAAEAASSGDFAAAEAHYLTAHDLLPEAAASWYHLAHLCAALGRVQEGRDYYRRAIDLDPSYRTAYNSAGFWYLWNHRRRQARRAFERTLRLDPDDAHAHLGLGLVAIREKAWARAASSLQRALALDDRCVDAYRALGRLLARRHDHAAAIRAYERSLKLTLSGQRALADDGALGIGLDWTTPTDPEHHTIHADLARLYAATGAYTPAIAGYRMAIAGGANTVGNQARLALLYARTRRLGKGARALGQAATRVPRDLATWLKRRWRRLRRPGLELRRKVIFRRQLAESKPSMWV